MIGPQTSVWGKRSLADPGVGAATAWYNRAVALGASPPAATRTAMTTFYNSLFAAGFALSDFDWMSVLIGVAAGDTATNKYNQARVNIVNPGTFDWTVNSANASGHTATGIVGDGSMYWLNEYKSSTMSVDRKGSASFGVYINTNGAPVGLTTPIGIGAGTHLVRGGYAGQTQGAYGADTLCFTGSAGTGLIWVETNGTDALNLYDDGTSVATDNDDPATIPDLSASLFSLYNGTNPFQISSDKLQFCWHGRGFADDTERTAFRTAVETLLTALGGV